MKNTKLISVILTGLFLVAFAVITPMAINAQNGRYANVYSKSQVKNFIDNLEKSSNTFKKDFGKSIDQSNLNGTNTEDRFRGYVDDYENALDRLKDRYKDSNSWWDSRNEVQEMISRAEPVNKMMNGLSFAYQLESQWRNMRNDINKVADTFDLAGLNGGGWNGGNGGNGGWNDNGPKSNPPNWAQGTFYSNNNGGFRLTINGNGQVTQYGADGQSSYGRWYQDSVWVNGERYPVTKTNFGIRSYDQRTGQYNEYSKTDNGNGGGGNNNGPISNPPSWAQGTFYSTNNGGYRLTITGNGQVTQYGTDGQSSYGRWFKNSIYVDGYEYPVTKTYNGIRSLDRRTGQYNEYSKNQGGGNGNGNNNGPTSNPPNWAQGTFYSTNNGGYRLTIAGNGQVTQYGADGQSSYGRWYQDSIYVDGQEYPVTRTNYGIRSYDRTSGQYNDYSKNNGGNGGGGNGNGQISNPPNWAQGTFYSTNNNGYRLTITSNGQVTQTGPDGQTSYGRWYNNSIYIDNVEYPITRLNNGLSGTNRADGSVTTYRKQ